MSRNAVPEQDDGRATTSAKSEQGAEVRVSRDQYSVLVECGSKDVRIRGSPQPEGPNMQGVMPGSRQKHSDLRG